MLVSVKWVVLWSLWAARLVPQYSPAVGTSSGLVRGVVSPIGDHVSYNGIPYATVPERFQAPGPAPTWEGLFDAQHEHIRCQQSAGDVVLLGRRDCLVLHVYAPLPAPPPAPARKRLPVMVFVHGGGFFQGSSGPMIYGPRYLIRKGVILVTLNYRLNIQGFLCLGIKEAPGNAANKDQVAALRWVQRNIEGFGGDPDNVTIFGESAGGASISYLVLSPMTKGLFHKAITQSGSALCPWAYQFNPVYLASLLAKTMLYETQDPYELYNFFSNKTDAELILTRVPRVKGNLIVSEILYTPCAEREFEGIEPFLTESPYDVLSKGTYNRVPMIIGTNSMEGLLLAGLDNETMMSQVDFERALPKNLNLTSEDLRKQIAGDLKRFYLGETETNDPVKISYLYGEPNLQFPSLAEVEMMLNAGSKEIYTYIFDYSGRRNVPKMMARKPLNVPTNATHADELFYLFSQQIVPTLFEDQMIDKITTLWTNFAKYGQPTPRRTALLPVRWPAASRPSPRSLLIRDTFSVAPMWYSPSLLYLRDVYQKHRRWR